MSLFVISILLALLCPFLISTQTNHFNYIIFLTSLVKLILPLLLLISLYQLYLLVAAHFYTVINAFVYLLYGVVQRCCYASWVIRNRMTLRWINSGINTWHLRTIIKLILLLLINSRDVQGLDSLVVLYSVCYILLLIIPTWLITRSRRLLLQSMIKVKSILNRRNSNTWVHLYTLQLRILQWFSVICIIVSIVICISFASDILQIPYTYIITIVAILDNLAWVYWLLIVWNFINKCLTLHLLLISLIVYRW